MRNMDNSTHRHPDHLVPLAVLVEVLRGAGATAQRAGRQATATGHGVLLIAIYIAMIASIYSYDHQRQQTNLKPDNQAAAAAQPLAVHAANI